MFVRLHLKTKTRHRIVDGEFQTNRSASITIEVGASYHHFRCAHATNLHGKYLQRGQIFAAYGSVAKFICLGGNGAQSSNAAKSRPSRAAETASMPSGTMFVYLPFIPCGLALYVLFIRRFGDARLPYFKEARTSQKTDRPHWRSGGAFRSQSECLIDRQLKFAGSPSIQHSHQDCRSGMPMSASEKRQPKAAYSLPFSGEGNFTCDCPGIRPQRERLTGSALPPRRRPHRPP